MYACHGESRGPSATSERRVLSCRTSAHRQVFGGDISAGAVGGLQVRGAGLLGRQGSRRGADHHSRLHNVFRHRPQGLSKSFIRRRFSSMHRIYANDRVFTTSGGVYLNCRHPTRLSRRLFTAEMRLAVFGLVSTSRNWLNCVSVLS